MNIRKHFFLCSCCWWLSRRSERFPSRPTPSARVPPKSTSYEITMNATKADLRTETQLVLFQQQ